MSKAHNLSRNAGLQACPLCLRIGVELRNSHLIPKAVYHRLREDGNKYPDPIHLADSIILQTSKQTSDYLLCNDCEQRFSKYGEDWVLKNGLRIADKQFRFRDTLSAVDSRETARGSSVYFEVDQSAIEALTYFSLSVFWRAAVHTWKTPTGNEINISLGKYQEPIREFLRTGARLPENCLNLFCFVASDDSFCGGAVLPLTMLSHPYHHQSFSAAGFTFYLYTGKQIPDNLAPLALYPTGAVIKAPWMDERLIEALLELNHNCHRVRFSGGTKNPLNEQSSISTHVPLQARYDGIELTNKLSPCAVKWSLTTEY